MKASPLLPTALLALSAALPAAAHGDLHERIAELDKLIAGRPGDAKLLLARAGLQFEHEAYDAALADLLAARALAPDAAEYPFLLARSYAAAKLPLTAIRELAPFLKAHPDHGDGWLVTARALAATGQFAESGAAFDAAAAHLVRVEPQVVLEQAAAFEQAGRPEDALARVAAGRAKLGAHVPSLVERTLHLLVRLGRIPEALAELDAQAAHLQRKDPFLIRKAQLLSANGRRDEAIAAYRQAREAIRALPAHLQGRPDVQRNAADIAAELDKLTAASPAAPKP